MKRKTLILTRKEYLKVSTMLTTLTSMGVASTSIDVQWSRIRASQVTTHIVVLFHKNQVTVESSPASTSWDSQPRVRREVHNSLSEFMNIYGHDESDRGAVLGLSDHNDAPAE